MGGAERSMFAPEPAAPQNGGGDQSDWPLKQGQGVGYENSFWEK